MNGAKAKFGSLLSALQGPPAMAAVVGAGKEYKKERSQHKKERATDPRRSSAEPSRPCMAPEQPAPVHKKARSTVFRRALRHDGADGLDRNSRGSRANREDKVPAALHASSSVVAACRSPSVTLGVVPGTYAPVSSGAERMSKM